MRVLWPVLLVLLAGGVMITMAENQPGLSESNASQQPEQVYPGVTWEMRAPEEVGLVRDKLDALKDLVGGRGCVVRHGYMVYTWGDQSKSADIASAVKPVISTLLLFAVQEGKIKSVDDKVAEFEPRLKTLNNGKDADITWRHLASQTSGYGLAEPPGEAYAYNDYAMALYYDVLIQKVFKEDGTHILKTRLADVLQFQDRYTFEAFGPNDRPGRLAISVRDFARFGLLYLRNGRWRSRQLLKPELIRLVLSSPVPADTPLTSGKEAEMLPNQRSLGGGKNQTPVGPGYYSFNWWLNRTDNAGRRLYVDAPPDTYVASGHGGKRMLWVIPSLDLIVSWNDAEVDDHDASPGNPNTKCNQAARLMKESVVEMKGSVAEGRKIVSMGPTIQWVHLSSKTGDLPVPPGSDQQTLCLVLDADKDGRNEFVIGCRGKAPALVWFRPEGKGWKLYIIENEAIPIEAGGAFCDIDGDGDLDIVAGEDYQGNGLYWWENPYPNYDPNVPWRRHVIKADGAKQHHDQIFGDFDGDGKPELVFWNQGASKLFLAKIPPDPKAGPWAYTAIFQGAGEGLAAGDVDGDGRIELLAGGRWFKHKGGMEFSSHVIDPAQSHPRIAVGDLNGDGKLEVVMVPGDGVGRLKWYEHKGDPTGVWVGHDLLGFDVKHGHSLAVADFNGDGYLDIFCAEMRKWTQADDNPDAKMWLFLGDGKGNFTKTEIASGYGVHEAKVADLDGDDRPDIVAKPYNWDTPRIDLWLSRSAGVTAMDLGIQGSQFTLNGRPLFLLGISYYGALGASEEFIKRDLDDMQRYGFNWIRVWATWDAFGNDVSAVEGKTGAGREPFLSKLKSLIAECDRRGMVVDVTLSRGSGSLLQSLEAHRRAVETLVTALKEHRNWYLDLANERNIRDLRFVSFEELKELRDLAKRLDPERLITASHAGDIGRDDLREYLLNVRVDFISPHRPRNPDSPKQTEEKSRGYLSWMKEIGRIVPLHYQEPFRRGYGKWQPKAEDFITDLRGAKAGGAAGWCFHNGDQKDRPEGKPRRSFDLREKRLFDQIDEEERKAIENLCRLFAAQSVNFMPRTRVGIVGDKWHINGVVTYPGAKAEGLLMNVRMVNAVFEDRNRPDFDPDANTNRFIAQVPDYVAHGVRAFTVNLQGGFPGYEGAMNSAFNPDGSLRESYLKRVRRVIEACNRQGAVVILGCYYQRQDQILKDADAVRAGVANVVKWVQACGFTNVVLEIANEFPHNGFDHAVLRTAEGQVELIRLAKRMAPDLLVSTSGIGDGRLPESVAQASDFLLIHFNSVPIHAIPERIAALKKFGKPIVCNEDDKVGEEAARAAEVSVAHGASWGLMLKDVNQYFPFTFDGAADDPVVYAKLKELTTR